MYQLFIGSLLLSLIHASIPNHWIPIVAIGKSEKWTTRQSILTTVIAGFAHTLSTVFVGIVVGFAGYKLSARYEFISGIVAPSILVMLGIGYLFLDYRGAHGHHHRPGKDLNHQQVSDKKGKLKWKAILTSLSISMFLTPCIEIEAYYFQSGTIGWTGIAIVSAVYTFTTVVAMMVLVYLGMKGINRFNSHFLEHHEKGVTGIVLLTLGMLAFL
jgi:hypothetical protein